MGKGVKGEKDRTRTQLKGEEQSKAVCLRCPHPLCEFLRLSFLPTKSPKLHHYSSRSQAYIFKCYYFISSNSALKSLKAVQRSYPNSLHSYKGLPSYQELLHALARQSLASRTQSKAREANTEAHKMES